MNFELTKEQLMVKDMAHKFAEREIIPLLSKYERVETPCFELVKKLASAGLIGLRIPTEYGGGGMDPLTSIIVSEELGWASVSLPSLGLNAPNLPGAVILEAGSEAQKQHYLPAMCRGEMLVAMGITEANAGSDVFGVQTTIERAGDEWVINGTKNFCSGGQVADTVLVLGRDKSLGPRAFSVVAVDRGTRGFAAADIKGKVGFRGTPLATLAFTDCRVPLDNLIGEAGRGLKQSMGGVNVARLEIAAAWVGLSQSCLDSCVKYAKERSQFGKPIGAFQLVQGTIAEMAARIDSIRWFIYYVAELVARNVPRVQRQVAEAKLLATELSLSVTAEALKIHGAYGLMDDLLVEHHYRDAIAGCILGGASNVLKANIARDLLGKDVTAA
jgi:alkylation response protein AidB-like acyl-CoA dehydrogenase